jgi:Pyridoxamine 5'-phosphate oxidase
MVVAKEGFKSMADTRGTVTGVFGRVPEDEVAACRELYLAAHPEAYWVDFGDFHYMRMKEIVQCNYIGGFGRATKVCCRELRHGDACSSMRQRMQSDNAIGALFRFLPP